MVRKSLLSHHIDRDRVIGLIEEFHLGFRSGSFLMRKEQADLSEYQKENHVPCRSRRV
jgi:hypothetical protein